MNALKAVSLLLDFLLNTQFWQELRRLKVSCKLIESNMIKMTQGSQLSVIGSLAFGRGQREKGKGKRCQNEMLIVSYQEAYSNSLSIFCAICVQLCAHASRHVSYYLPAGLLSLIDKKEILSGRLTALTSKQTPCLLHCAHYPARSAK